MAKNQDAYTLSQAIKRYGKDFSVERNILNDFNEPAGKIPVGSFRGLYHVSTGYLDISLTDAAKISTRKYPQILLLYTKEIQKEDIITLEGREYLVTGVDDVGGLHLCTELSLKEGN